MGTIGDAVTVEVGVAVGEGVRVGVGLAGGRVEVGVVVGAVVAETTGTAAVARVPAEADVEVGLGGIVADALGLKVGCAVWVGDRGASTIVVGSARRAEDETR